MGRKSKLNAGAASRAVRPLRYELVPIGMLRPNPSNARKHPKSQLRELKRSYEEFGVLNPPIVSPDFTIIAGHGRYAAAKELGLTELPVLIADNLSPAQLRAYALTDNKLGDLSSFDMKLVLEEIEAICFLEADYDLTLTGFSTPELDAAVGATRTAEMNDLEDDQPEEPPVTPVGRKGDLWLMDKHRLINGDATDTCVTALVIGGEAVQLTLSDVPFNVKIKGNVSGLGRKVHREFAMASGEMSYGQFVAFLSQSIAAFKDHLVDGAMVLLFIDWRHVAEMLEAGAAMGLALKNILVWSKENAGMGSLWRSQHELVVAFKHGEAAHINNVALGKYGRHRSNILQYPGMNSPGRGRGKALDLHPTVKPVALIADLMLDVSDRGGIVFHPFCGSGTAIIAAEKTGRVAYGVEIDPGYVDVSVKRWQALTGHEARLAETGQTFAEVMAERLGTDAGEARHG